VRVQDLGTVLDSLPARTPVAGEINTVRILAGQLVDRDAEGARDRLGDGQRRHCRRSTPTLVARSAWDMPGSPWRWRMTSFITIDKGVLIVLVLLIHTAMMSTLSSRGSSAGDHGSACIGPRETHRCDPGDELPTLLPGRGHVYRSEAREP
jgi:hypothetical protein